MLGYYQRTIRNSVSCYGVGLHTGHKVTIAFHPAKADTGIVFRRTDVKENGIIPATYENVCNTMLGTTLTNGEHQVATIEHLMAALWGEGVDNCYIDIDGDEVPIMDGSSEPFVFLIECAGVVELSEPRKVIEILKEVRVEEENGDGYVSLIPADDFTVSLEIDFGDNVISRQKGVFDLRDVSFKSDLCRARTFGFAHEVEMLRQKGLARGGSLDNAIVVDKDGVMNKEGLRYNDEFVRHKILDCIGDVFLAGGFLRGHVVGYKSGHCLNNKLLRALFADKAAWRYSSMPQAASTAAQNGPVAHSPSSLGGGAQAAVAF